MTSSVVVNSVHGAGGGAPVVQVVVFIDDELLRLGLQTLLPGLAPQVSARFPRDVPELRHQLAQGPADVILATAASRPEVELTGTGPRILLLVDEREVTAGFDVAASPADGYLIRQKLTAEALERALVQITSGEMPLPAELGRMLLGRGRGAVLALGSARLTFREQEALTHLAHGLSNRQIATRMRISEHGAKRLVSSLLLKLGATNRTAAVVTAIKYGLVEGTAADH
jgi:DNA-binding NarL/FixJ family response regulator